MKTLEEIQVSVYESVYSKKPQVTSFQEAIFMCIKPTYASIIHSIRRYHQDGDHEAAQQMKIKLPCFTPAGTFDGAHAIKNFLQPSNIVGLDYDHVTKRLEIIRLCAEDPHTVAALESPTDGVKIFAYVEGIEGRYREAQQIVSHYYDQLLKLESDPACKDESRLCYFTYSPNGYIASLYQPFELEYIPETGNMNATGNSSVFNETTVPEISEEEVGSFLSSYIFLNPLVPGKRHSNLFKLACEAGKRQYPQESVLRGIMDFFKGTDFTSEEIKSVLHSGYQTVSNGSKTSRPTFPPSAQNDKTTKTTYDAFEGKAEEDEEYWQGEEYRKNTPCFPESVYENLPNLLEGCILEDEGERENDISMLSVFTAISAALPHTFGIYNHKKYTPHFYTVIIAPAGSGKSVAQTGRYLLDEIQQYILSQSEHQQKAYQKEHIRWQKRCMKKENCEEEMPDAPERPAFKMLFIPATTSYTRMQIQMRDNEGLGGIIFDTEAETLTTANHLDCGNFNDMLRKAYEHENIESSYKANGMTPIIIKHPSLAMFLTGTPGQLEALLGSYENGLTSRIGFYTFRLDPNWKSMDDDSVSQEEIFHPLAHQVFELFNFCLDHPVLFHFKRSQWDQLNRIFSGLLKEVVLEGNDDLQAVVKRYAVLVMRISMIQTRIRQFETNDLSPDIYCNDIDFQRSLEIVLCCYEHSRLLLSPMTSLGRHPLKDPNITRRFINELSDTFTTDEAIKAGANYGFSSRKINRLLKSLNGVIITKISHGSYRKLSDQ